MIPLSRPMLGEEEERAVRRVLASGTLAQGPEVDAFEDEFSSVVSGRHCVAVSSATSGLHLALLAFGIGPGDEVIVPSFTFAGTVNAVRLVGAEAVFVDIDPDTFCVDPTAVEAAISRRTAALIPVHLYGHPAALAELHAIATRNGLLLIEDAAQAHMASLDGRPVGTWGDVAVFSFHATKNMTTGEGGMVATGDPDLGRRLRRLRSQEEDDRLHTVGFNARMPEISAAIGRAQLARLAAFTFARRSNAAVLDERLRGTVPPSVAKGAEHAFHLYTVRAPDRDGLARRLAARGVGFGVYYRVPVHRLPPHTACVDLPETERATREVLSLPVGPHLTATDIDAIVDAVNT
jgi:perosamine synthetase